MADVFISYDENSAGDIVRQISETLEKDGISCWYAGRDMKKDALRGVTTKAIRDCRVFLLVLNENALKSAYVQSEIALVTQGFGDERKQELVAFRVDSDVSVETRLDAFLEQLRARDDFSSTFGHFRIMDGCPPDELRIANLVFKLALELVLFDAYFLSERMKNRKWTFTVGYNLLHSPLHPHKPLYKLGKPMYKVEAGYKPLHSKLLKPVLSVLAAIIGKVGEGLAGLSETLSGKADN